MWCWQVFNRSSRYLENTVGIGTKNRGQRWGLYELFPFWPSSKFSGRLLVLLWLLTGRNTALFLPESWTKPLVSFDFLVSFCLRSLFFFFFFFILFLKFYIRQQLIKNLRFMFQPLVLNFPFFLFVSRESGEMIASLFDYITWVLWPEGRYKHFSFKRSTISSCSLHFSPEGAWFISLRRSSLFLFLFSGLKILILGLVRFNPGNSCQEIIFLLKTNELQFLFIFSDWIKEYPIYCGLEVRRFTWLIHKQL